jgi:zinc/manganese transport system substrate-binding protein
MIKKLSRPFGILVAAVSAVALAGCAPQAPEASAPKPTIVATTNVWANIAQQVAGDYFEVTALISDPAIDPHSYEAGARDQLAISEAALFVINGGGYDDFALTLASSTQTPVFNAYEVHEAAEHAAEEHGAEEDHAGEEHAEDEGHEDHGHDGSDHTWYDLHLVKHVAQELAHTLGELQPENAEAFDANAAAFGADIEVLEAKRDSMVNSEIHYFEAHPLASLLFMDLEFHNHTPEGFAESEEAELEPSAKTLSEAQEVISAGKVAFMAVNRQVTSPTLETLKQLALDSGVKVLEFDELLPPETSYQEWMDSVLDSIAAVR